MKASMRLNCAVVPSYRVASGGSHTLRNCDREPADARRANLLEDTVQALAGDGDPRLVWSRAPA